MNTNTVHWVYLIGNPYEDIFKIGYTNHLKKRLCTLQTSNKLPLEVLYSFPVLTRKQAVVFEQYFKTKFKKFRGEFLNLTKTDLENLKCDFEDFGMETDIKTTKWERKPRVTHSYDFFNAIQEINLDWFKTRIAYNENLDYLKEYHKISTSALKEIHSEIYGNMFTSVVTFGKVAAQYMGPSKQIWLKGKNVMGFEL